MCYYLAMSNYFKSEGCQVERIHHKTQLVPGLFQKVFQPFVPQTFHVRPHHSYKGAEIDHQILT